MNPLPFLTPERLPKRIDPCPIVEAVVELRFISHEPWRNIPGMLAPLFRPRYPEESELPLNEIPEAIRQHDNNLAWQPLVQYAGPEFTLRFGPRVLTLVTPTHRYPGWARCQEELSWILEQVSRAGFVQEGERLGVRYVDFFTGDIFPRLLLEVGIAGRPVQGLEQNVTLVIPEDRATARLVLANGAVLNDGAKTETGSVLDLDVWHRFSSADLLREAPALLDRLHSLNKRIFFGLLKPEFLATLNPEY